MSKTQSLAQQIAELEVEDSHVRLERLPIAGASDETIKAVLARVRNASNQITNRLRKKDGSNYRVESISMLAPDRASIFCMAVTTRIDEEDDIGI